MRSYLLCCLTICMSLTVFATNYYVAKDGLDSNPGTESAPFLTINKAASVLQAGDTCFIKAGVYREVLDPANNGQANAPIVFTQYQQDSVVISATEVLANWSVYQGNVYQAAYDMNLGRQNMVYVNGKPMDWARWPNNADHDPYTVEAISVVSGTESSIQSPDITNMDWSGGYIWYLGAHSGASWTRPITASQSGNIDFVGVDIDKWPFNPHNPTIFRNGNRGQFYLFGVLEALDYAEEWYYDEATDLVYLQAPGDGDPNTMEIEVGARERSMLIRKNYIHIDGIHAFGGNVEITGEYCVIRNGTFTQCLNILDELDNSDAQVSKGVIHVRGSHTIVEHNIIDGSSINGVFVQGWNNISHPTIRFNIIRNCNTVGIHSSPIRCGASNTLLISNTIHTTGRDGIYCSGFDNEIAYNDVYDCMKINNDGGLFYTVGTSSPRNMDIHHNWFHDSEGPAYADGRAAGIYLDNDSKGFSVHHNVVWNITWSGIQMNWDIWDNDIYHNTLWDVSRAMGTWLKPEHTMQRIKVYNNLSNFSGWEGTDIQHNIIQDANPFTDYDGQNFIPRIAASPIDSGLVIAGINDNYQGSLPDIGAYEWGLTPWRPGVNTVLGGDIVTSISGDVDGRKNGRVYPNPLRDQPLTVLMPEKFQSATIAVYDVQGKLVYQTESHQPTLLIDNSIFEMKGVYLIHVQHPQLSWTQKVVVK